MHLRGKIKSKCKKIENHFNKDTEAYIALKANLEKISALSFNQSTDYQLLVNCLYDITVKIHSYINSKYRNLPIDTLEKPQAEAKEKCTQLVTYDKAHMIILVEIVQTTNELREKISKYNELTNLEKGHKKITFIPDAIEIENFDLINSIVETAKLTTDLSPAFSDIEKSLFDDAS
jgi:phage gp36-like protein